MKTIISLLSFTFCLLSFSPSAQIINVPGDYPTIQEGIDAAGSWFDTVLVAPGTYYENINFNGKRITVASNFCLSEDTMDIKNTIINGSQPTNPDIGSVVTFTSYEDTTSILCGFTITGGTGSIVIPGVVRAGGGIVLNNSGAKIINNYIEFNSCNGEQAVVGGGIGHGPPTDPNYIVIRNNKICNNEAIGALQAAGGGINLSGHAIICNNLICNNKCKNLQMNGDNPMSFGGGLDVGPNEGVREIFIAGNLISDNQALSESNLSFNSTGAGGVRLIRTSGSFINNKITGNIIGANNIVYGCGLAVVLVDMSLTIINNTIANNNFMPGECWGGGLFVEKGTAKFINNLVYENHATYGGGCFLYDDEGTAGNNQIINNTIADNVADEDGGAIYIYDMNPYIFNSILWNNESGTGNEISGDCEVRFSCVDGGYPGVGNIPEDPEFIDPDNDIYLLDDESPCIDAGDPEVQYNDLEDPLNPGSPLFPSQGTMRNDMGFTGGPHAPPDIINGVPEPIMENSSDQSLIVYPNPCSIKTNLRFTSPACRQAGRVSRLTTIDLYTIDGRKIRSLMEKEQLPGNLEIEIDVSDLPSGVYFIRMHVENEIATKKLVVQ